MTPFIPAKTMFESELEAGMFIGSCGNSDHLLLFLSHTPESFTCSMILFISLSAMLGLGRRARWKNFSGRKGVSGTSPSPWLDVVDPEPEAESLSLMTRGRCRDYDGDDVETISSEWHTVGSHKELNKVVSQFVFWWVESRYPVWRVRQRTRWRQRGRRWRRNARELRTAANRMSRDGCWKATELGTEQVANSYSLYAQL